VRHPVTSELEPPLDALFQVPLEEFVEARNALAAELKKAGRGEEAGLVKALPKPSASAWAVNQLFWRHREAFDRLMEAGARFRQAQAAQLAGQPGDLREPLAARGSSLTELTRHAAAALRGASYHPTPVLMRRLTLTLEALSAYGELAEHLRPGRLTKDVDPPGFDSLAALVPRIGGLPKAITIRSKLLAFDRPVVPEPTTATTADERRALEKARKLARAAAADALEKAAGVVRVARATLTRAEESVRKAAGRVKEAESEKLRIEQALEQASAKADTARQEARGLTAAAAEAAETLAEAEGAADTARAEVSRFDEL
jgi:hypothetical protein